MSIIAILQSKGTMNIALMTTSIHLLSPSEESSDYEHDNYNADDGSDKNEHATMRNKTNRSAFIILFWSPY